MTLFFHNLCNFPCGTAFFRRERKNTFLSGDDLALNPRPRPGQSNQQLEPDRRALALVAAYFWERLNCRNSSWEIRWDEIEPGRRFNVRLVTLLRNPDGELPADDLKLLYTIMTRICSAPSNREKIIEDYHLVGPMFKAAMLTQYVFPNTVDYRFHDQTLLSILTLTDHVPDNQPSQLIDSIGGLWHVIRRNTSSGEDEFNVSLLNVKPLVHYRKADVGDAFEAVVSYSPRFSLRSRGEFIGSQEYRGFIVKLGTNIYFLSNREDKNFDLSLMCWSEPTRRDGANIHADFATGLMLINNTKDQQITAPIVAQFIERDSDTLLARRGVVDDQLAAIMSGNLQAVSPENQKEADFWRTKTTQGIARAKRYTRSQLTTELERFNLHVSIDDLVTLLESKIVSGPNGFFRL